MTASWGSGHLRCEYKPEGDVVAKNVNHPSIVSLKVKGQGDPQSVLHLLTVGTLFTQGNQPGYAQKRTGEEPGSHVTCKWLRGSVGILEMGGSEEQKDSRYLSSTCKCARHQAQPQIFSHNKGLPSRDQLQESICAAADHRSQVNIYGGSREEAFRSTQERAL